LGCATLTYQVSFTFTQRGPITISSSTQHGWSAGIDNMVTVVASLGINRLHICPLKYLRTSMQHSHTPSKGDTSPTGDGLKIRKTAELILSRQEWKLQRGTRYKIRILRNVTHGLDLGWILRDNLPETGGLDLGWILWDNLPETESLDLGWMLWDNLPETESQDVGRILWDNLPETENGHKEFEFGSVRSSLSCVQWKQCQQT
jgi:hypothetical protein